MHIHVYIAKIVMVTHVLVHPPTHLPLPPRRAWTHISGWREGPSPPLNSLLSSPTCLVMQLPQDHPGPSSVVALGRREGGGGGEGREGKEWREGKEGRRGEGREGGKEERRGEGSEEGKERGGEGRKEGEGRGGKEGRGVLEAVIHS